MRGWAWLGPAVGLLSASACGGAGADTPETDTEAATATGSDDGDPSGDEDLTGDGDPTGDGDGDPSGDGDGDPTGDGDGDPTGDGDGDPTGDGDGDPIDPARVLFIGNSYTFFNDLPQLVETMSAGSGAPLAVESLTMGGARVSDHLGNPQLAELLDQGFDVVVIQGQSVEPILDYPGFEAAVVELAGMAGDARVLLYQTWPRKQGSPDLVDLGLTVDEMWAGLEAGYAGAAVASASEVAPVGAAFVAALELDPPIELYAPDLSHPSPAGSYLAGCVFFDVILGTPCATSNYAPPGLRAADVERLQMIADVTTGLVDP